MKQENEQRVEHLLNKESHEPVEGTGIYGYQKKRTIQQTSYWIEPLPDKKLKTSKKPKSAEKRKKASTFKRLIVGGHSIALLVIALFTTRKSCSGYILESVFTAHFACMQT
jgi:hypothetical protein